MPGTGRAGRIRLSKKERARERAIKTEQSAILYARGLFIIFEASF